MPFLSGLAPIIAAITGVAGLGTGIGEAVAGAHAPKAATAAPTTPQVNPTLAYQAVQDQQSQAPGANAGLVTQLLSSETGIGANTAINPGFTPSGVGPGTSNPVGNQGPYYLSDLVNQVMGS